MPLWTQALGLLSVVLALAGAAFCALHVTRSRFVVLLMLGFFGQAVVGLAYRVVPLVLGISAAADMRTVFGVLQAAGLVAQAAVVGGVAGLLTERRTAAVDERAA